LLRVVLLRRACPSSASGAWVANRRRTSWIDQFVLREDVNNPFVQVITSAQQVARVAEDRVGLTRVEYDEVATARYQARVLEDLARMLDEDVVAHGRKADEALAGETDPVVRARVLTNALTGAVRASAMLVDACHTLLGLSEKLLVIRRPASRLTLMAAVEQTRAAASTAHLTVLVNLPRITDVALYDELNSGIDSFDVTLARANRVASALRSEVRVGQSIPAQLR
jgi:formiminotetrahydrofolate cyclodeaminase